jgi:hypothetical protein
MLGAIAGGVSGAVGYFIAGKFHGDEKVTQIYPIYAVILFGIAVGTSRLLLPH